MSNKTKGIACIVASAFCFALMNVFVRLSGDIPSIEKSFFRNLIALMVAAAVILKEKEGFRYERKALPDLLLRSICGTIGLLCNFYAVDHLLLADATAIQKLVPFITTISGYFILKEKIKSWQLGVIAMAFASSLLIIKPGWNGQPFPVLIQILGALGAGLAYTYVRKLTLAGVSKSKIIFFFSAFSCLAVIPFILVDFKMPDGQQLLFLLLTGLCASGGQFAVTYAYSYAPAGQISVYDYSQIVFSALLGFFVFGQVADWLSWLGYILLISIAILNFWLQGRSSKKERVS